MKNHDPELSLNSILLSEKKCLKYQRYTNIAILILFFIISNLWKMRDESIVKFCISKYICFIGTILYRASRYSVVIFIFIVIVGIKTFYIRTLSLRLT